MSKLKETIQNCITAKRTARFFLAVIIGLVMLGSLPVPVQAQDEYDPEIIDLVLGGEGATPWNFDDIMPCDSGTKTVTLHNAGTEDGFVIAWISDIDSGECVDTEPETDTSDLNGGELDDHLLLGLSASSGLSPNPHPPTEIINFPTSASASNIIINPLNSGDTVTLTWDWELPCSTGNDAQGDCLSFTINYLLEELTPPPPPPPPPRRRPPEREPFIPPPPLPPRPPSPEPSGTVAEIRICPDDVLVSTDPGLCIATQVNLGIPQCIYEECVAAITNDAPEIFPLGNTIVTWTTTDIEGNVVTCTQIVTVIEGDRYLEIDMLGEITRVRLVCPNCTVAQTSVASDPNDMHFLTIENGTHVLCIEDDTTFSCPELIVMSLSEETLSVPEGYILLSPIYEFIGYRDKELLYPICSHVNFDLPITMLLSYDPAELTPDASPPFIVHIDPENNVLVRLEHAGVGQVAEVGEVNGLTQQLSLFAVMAELPTNPYRVQTNLPGVSSVDWRLIVGIVGGTLLALGLVLFHRRRRRRRLTTGS